MNKKTQLAIDLKLDNLHENWMDLQKDYQKALVSHNFNEIQRLLTELKETQTQQVEIVSRTLGYDVEFIRPPEKFWLLKHKKTRYQAVAIFEFGRLRTIIKTKKAGYFSKLRYLLNGQALKGSENIYWRQIR